MNEFNWLDFTNSKKGTGRKALPKSLPYIEQIHDLSDEEKHCTCGCALTHKHIHHVACWAHARRYFVAVAKAHKKQGLAHQVVALIGKLYHLERELKDKQAMPALIFFAKQTPWSNWSNCFLITLTPLCSLICVVYLTSLCLKRVGLINRIRSCKPVD